MKFCSPYQNSTFKSIWMKHFQPNGRILKQTCFTGVDFYKPGYLPVYLNVGATNTKGISYGLDEECNLGSLFGNIFLIFDVPDDNTSPDNLQSNSRFKQKKIPQYPGYICDFSKSESVGSYLKKNMSSRSYAKLRNYQNKLDRDFDVTYKMIWGNIPIEGYEVLFDQFYALLAKRFEYKKTVNNNLDKAEWLFYKDVSYPMLKNKEAGLFVTYIKERPVAMTLMNFSGAYALDVIRGFDTDYAQYRIGSISLMQQMDWCIENGYNTLDFSKGYYEYKKRWSTDSYLFHYHIWYDSHNLACKVIANILSLKFWFKFWARKYNFQVFVHKIRYRLRKKF